MIHQTYTNEDARQAVRILWFLALVLFLVFMAIGCKSTSAKYDAKTGDWSVRDTRVFLRTEAEITATLDANGNKSVNIKAKSDPAAEAMKAVAEGAAAGAVKGLKP